MKRIMLLMAVSAFMVSCDSRTYADISPVVTNPTYQANVSPIVKANCTGCHSGGTFPQLTNYAQVVDAAQNGKFLCKINGQCGGIMPPSGKLANVTVDMINRWVQQGYVEN